MSLLAYSSRMEQSSIIEDRHKRQIYIDIVQNHIHACSLTATIERKTYKVIIQHNHVNSRATLI
jgi:hypothetical protein